MLANDKPSAIFRLRNTAQKSSSSSDPSETSMDDDTLSPSSGAPVTATLGISIEPLAAVQAQVSTLHPGTPGSSTALVPFPPAVLPPSAASAGALSTRILQHLFNYVTSYATGVVPIGSITLGSDSTYLPMKAFQSWYDAFTRKVRTDPGFLLKDS
ncbi:hypothetical protein BC936DRAFT_149838 [Jimgerdemannia flammicorona]|uniref:Uncharacterized protein n=2 Tax=Jimgerdemannia flammicorona TaxID=994334 RepID=A0A433D016_9FUNG|nr:hypothetical protein BC936DRAFT_149838 [Jimgerdemannia flammicorona]RUS30036.1 hypothetical protein BC938DRAFT_479923 [Jimgerdemannia flammicorona]